MKIQIKNSVEDRQLRIAWQTVKEARKKKITFRTKLKAASQEDQIKTWKENFENLFKFTDKPITKIIKSQLNIELGEFTPEELNVVLTRINSRKVADLDEIPQKYGRHRDLMTLFDFATPYMNRIQYRDRQKAIYSFP